jgi:hypothetical protein
MEETTSTLILKGGKNNTVADKKALIASPYWLEMFGGLLGGTQKILWALSGTRSFFC